MKSQRMMSPESIGGRVSQGDSKKRKNDSTVQNYTHILNEFGEQLASSVKFIDQVDRKVLNSHITYLENEKAAEPKTIRNKLGVIFQLTAAW